jgi:hypothetical protein
LAGSYLSGVARRAKRDRSVDFVTLRQALDRLWTFDRIAYLLTMSSEPILPSVKRYPKSTETKWARMGYWLLALLTFNFALLISACGLDIEDPTPPSPPQWVQKSLPEEWPERGIDAHEIGGIFLEWESNLPRENISEYLLYRARNFIAKDSLGAFHYLTSVQQSNPSSLGYIDREILESSMYTYRLLAIDDSDNSSPYSDSISYTWLLPVEQATMSPNGLSDPLDVERKLHWAYEYHIRMESYCITILDSNNDLILRHISNPNSYVGGSQAWQIPLEISLVSGNVYKWRVDLDGGYIDQLETAGSESLWATFLYLSG